MTEEHNRVLHSEEDMLALAEELAAHVPVAVGYDRLWRPKPWQEKGLWFLGGSAAASLVWWLL